MNAQAHCGRMFSGLYPATRRNAEVKPFCAVMFKPPWPRGNHIRLECWLLYSAAIRKYTPRQEIGGPASKKLGASRPLCLSID